MKYITKKKFRDSYRLGGSCAECDNTTNLTIDHIIPLSLNGLDDILNYDVLCASCNTAKADSLYHAKFPVIPSRELYHYYVKNTLNGNNSYKLNVFLNCFGKADYEELDNTYTSRGD